MTLWELLGKGAEVAEKVDDTIEGARRSKQDVEDARDLAEATVGRGILTGRFIKRGRNMTARLKKQSEEGKPPGILKTGEEIFDFLTGDRPETKDK